MFFDICTQVFLFVAGLLPILGAVGGFGFLCFSLWLLLSDRGRGVVEYLRYVTSHEFRCEKCTISHSCKARLDPVPYPCVGFRRR